jgi:hypothetical protein
MNPGETAPFGVLLALSEMTALDGWVRLAMSLSLPHGTVLLRGMVAVPEDKSLSEGATQARQLRDELDAVARSCPEH